MASEMRISFTEDEFANIKSLKDQSHKGWKWFILDTVEAYKKLKELKL